MGNPTVITISVEALTEQANAKLTSFLAGLDTKLNSALQKSAAAQEKFFITPSNPGLKKILDDVGDSATKTTTKIAGMSYYFRSAIDGIRVAAAGGGARAGFYAIDEAIRGLLASGLGLGTLIPIIGGIAAAVGAGYLVWNEWTSATRAAEKSAKDLHEQMEGLAKIYVQIRDLQKAGLLSPEAVKQNLDLLTGKTALYKTPEGEFTSNPTRQVADFSVQGISGSPVAPSIIDSGTTKTLANQKATAAEIQKYILDNIAVQGKLDETEVQASVKLKELRKEINTQSLLEVDQEKEAIHLKYEAEREDIRQLSVAMGGLLTPAQQKENDSAISKTFQNEATEKAAADFAVREKFQQAAEEAFAKGQQLFAEIVRKENAEMERALTSSAAQQGKTREEIYQQEYDARIRLLEGQLYAGEISEKEYTDAVLDADTKRLDGIKREQEELKRLQAVKDAMAQKDYDAQRRSIQANPFLNNAQKNQQLQAVNADNLADVGGQLAKNLATPLPAGTQQQIQLLETRKELQTQLNALLAEQNKLQDQTGLLNNLKAGWTEFYNTVSDTSRDMAKFMVSPFQGLRDGISQALQTVIEKGGSLKTFFAGVGQSIERSMIQSFANMAADWITKMAMMAIRWVATQIFMTQVQGEQSAIRTGIHILSEIAMTAASIAQSLIRRIAAFLEAQPYIFLAAVKAANAVADIPYVGPILAPIAAATTFAALEALAVFKEGGYTGDGPSDQVAGLVHRGEVVIPAERVQQTGVGRLLQYVRSGRFSPSDANLDSSAGAGGAGAGGATIQHKTNLSLAMFGGEADAKRWAEGQDGETWFLNQMDKHAYKYQRG